MSGNLDSLKELTVWEDYQQFMKDRLKQLPAGESPFYVTKEKIDFSVGGKPWKGFAVFAGQKSEPAVKGLKKDKVQFKEGKCSVLNNELAVTGIDATTLKQAATTLKKLKVGLGVAGVEAEDDAGPGPSTAVLDKRLSSLETQIERAAAVTTKETEPFVKEARKRADEARRLIPTDPNKATTLLKEGEELAHQAIVGILEGGKPSPAVVVETRRQELLAEIAAAEKLKDAANDDPIKQAKAAAEGVLAAIGKAQYDKAEQLLDGIESVLGQIVEGPDPASGADPDLTELKDWKAYRTFLKAHLKRLPKEGGPVFISREKVDFSIDGKPFQGLALLVGLKGKQTVTVMKRQGILFMEGTGKVDGKTLRVAGIKPTLVKTAAKSMVKLRLGLKLATDGTVTADVDETAENATTDPTGSRSLDKEIKEVADSLVKLREAVELQKKGSATLKKDADDKRKKADDLLKKARDLGDKGTDTDKDWDDATAAEEAAEAAKFAIKRAGTDSDRAANEVREFTERLHRIKDSTDADKKKKEELKKLKTQVAERLLDASVANMDPNDPNTGKKIADQIKKRFGVNFKLSSTKITGRDADGNQIFKDFDKKVDPKKEAETLKELYLTLSRAPDFPKSHLKNLKISLRPKESESEGGVYYEDSKTAEVTCRRPKESFNYGNQLNSAEYFPDGVDDNCKSANKDPVNYFDWATLHEVAHAVDAKHKFMNATRAGQGKYGGWTEYKDNPAPIAKIAADEFGKTLGGDDKKKLQAYALGLMKNKKLAAPSTAEQTAVKNWVDAIREGKGLWWDGAACKTLAIGGIVYQEAYASWWNSYSLTARKQGIHGYQFRAPGEWFAELYAAYYSDKLKPSHPFVPDLAQLEVPKK